MPKLRKIISGGQTGADFTALVEAKRIGLATGGTCPKGCRTDEGVNKDLVEIYGLVESNSSDYPPRTIANVRNAQVTLWFGRIDSPGAYCTRRACKDWHKQFMPNPSEDVLRKVANLYEVINVAGNRRRTNPGVVTLVEAAFKVIAAVIKGT